MIIEAIICTTALIVITRMNKKADIVKAKNKEQARTIRFISLVLMTLAFVLFIQGRNAGQFVSIIIGTTGAGTTIFSLISPKQ